MFVKLFHSITSSPNLGTGVTTQGFFQLSRFLLSMYFNWVEYICIFCDIKREVGQLAIYHYHDCACLPIYSTWNKVSLRSFAFYLWVCNGETLAIRWCLWDCNVVEFHSGIFSLVKEILVEQQIVTKVVSTLTWHILTFHYERIYCKRHFNNLNN